MKKKIIYTAVHTLLCAILCLSLILTVALFVSHYCFFDPDNSVKEFEKNGVYGYKYRLIRDDYEILLFNAGVSDGFIDKIMPDADMVKKSIDHSVNAMFGVMYDAEIGFEDYKSKVFQYFCEEAEKQGFGDEEQKSIADEYCADIVSTYEKLTEIPLSGTVASIFVYADSIISKAMYIVLAFSVIVAIFIIILDRKHNKAGITAPALSASVVYAALYVYTLIHPFYNSDIQDLAEKSMLDSYLGIAQNNAKICLIVSLLILLVFAAIVAVFTVVNKNKDIRSKEIDQE